MFTTKLDTSALNRKTKIFAKAMGISMRDAVEYQGGLLIKELVLGAPPKNLAKAKMKADSDLRRVFHPMVSRNGDVWKTFRTKKQRGGSTGITWLYATPSHLLGTNTADYKPQADLNELKSIYSAWNGLKTRSPKWENLGEVILTRQSRNGRFIKNKVTKRKRKGVTEDIYDTLQDAVRINRVVIRRSKFNAMRRYIKEKFGRFKASFAYGWDKLKVTGNLPQWVSKHLKNGKAPGQFMNGLNYPGKPYIGIISRAPGVESARFIANIKRAVKKRTGAIQADLRHYIAGAKKAADFRTQKGFAEVRR